MPILVQLTEQVIAASLLAVQQAVQLRIAQGELCFNSLNSDIQHMLQQLQQQHPLVAEDRPLEYNLRQLVSQLQQQHWPLYQDA